MTDILLQISSYKDEELSDMWITCRDFYKENDAQLDLIGKLQSTYEACKAVEYYTGNSCLSRTVNQACHAENMQQIFTFRAYISDLHKQLIEFHHHDEQNDFKSLITTLYRGKPLSGSVLQQLIDNKGGLITMNGFLSTTKNEEVASCYHGDDQVSKVHEGYKPVLFVLEVKTRIKQPYASISRHSIKPDEAEVLFSLGAIWRIKSIELDKNPCIIELISCDELDSQSAELLKKYTENGCTLSSVGDILHELENDDEAEWFYQKMLKQELLDGKTKGNLHYKIGMMRFGKKDYSTALVHFEEAASLLPSLINESAEIRESRPIYASDNQSPLIAIYNNMGLIRENDGEIKRAIHCYKKALEVKNGSKAEIATVYNNLGLLHYRNGNYQEARDQHMKSIELIDESFSKWVEFKRNFNCADQRCQHLAKKKQNDITQRTTTDGLI